jgi:hypothetical protein
MPATQDSIRKAMDVQETPRGVGLTLTVQITAYDNAFIQVGKNDTPMSGDTEAERWLNVVEYVTRMVNEFHQQVEARGARRSRALFGYEEDVSGR